MYSPDAMSCLPLSHHITCPCFVSLGAGYDKEEVATIKWAHLTALHHIFFINCSSSSTASGMSRPVTNLERILASINFQEDEVVLTPEPLLASADQHPLGAIGIGGIRVNSNSFEAKTEEEELVETPILSAFTSRTNTPISDEDVPLTVELMTPRVRVNSVSGFGQFGLCSMLEMGPSAFYETQSEEECEKRSAKRQLCLDDFSPKKTSPPFKLPASSESLLGCGDTSDGLDAYQERERDNRVVRLKKKTKKRQDDGRFKKGEKQGDAT